MPVYEYECSECGNIEEAFQKISDLPLRECSKCKGRLRKLVSHSSFHLKGSGWYVTDYGGSKAGSQNESKNDSDEAAKPTKLEKSEKPTAKAGGAAKKLNNQ